MDEPQAIFKTVKVKQSTAKPMRQSRDQRGRGRWSRRIFFMFAALSLVGWFVPTIIAIALTQPQCSKMLIPKFSGRIELSEASLSWLTPIVIKNLRVVDHDGQTLIEVPQCTSNETLWTMVTHPLNPGTIRISQPFIHVLVRDDGSNIEDLLNTVSMGPSSNSAGSSSNKMPINLIVEIDNAKIQLEHKSSNRTSEFEQISLRFVAVDGMVDEIDFAMGNPVTPKDGEVAPNPAVGEWVIGHYGNHSKDDPTKIVAGTKHAVIRASNWKLDRLEPGLRRVLPKAELSGELNVDAAIVLTQNDKGFDWDWNGVVSIQKLLVSGIEAMKQDRFLLEQVELSGRAATEHGRLAMHNMKLTTDVGEMNATGDVPLDGKVRKSGMELIQSLLSDEDYHINGRVDLKKLAALLPTTLRIRDGIEITAGDAKVEFVGVDANGVRRWSGVAGIVGLTANNQGKTIPWDQPLAARINAHRDRTSIVVDRFECKSEFLQVTGNGTVDDARFTATGDLAKLFENLARFIDVGAEQLSGQLKADGELRRIDGNQVALTSKIQLDNVECVVAKKSVWNEQHLELSIAAVGTTDSASVFQQIDSGEIHMKSGPDTLDMVLQKPIDLTSKSPTCTANARMKGDLASWQNRTRSFVPFDNWKLAGAIDMTSAFVADSQMVDVIQLLIASQNFRAIGPGWVIQEPDIKLESAMRWIATSRKLISQKSSLTSNSLSMQIDNLECLFSKRGQPTLSGNATYRADLKQISHWKNLAIENPTNYVMGNLTGTATVSDQNGVALANLDAQVEKFMIVGQNVQPDGRRMWVALLKEPQLKLTARAAYDGAADKLTVDSSKIEIDGVSAAVKGTLDACSSKRLIDVSGELAYDWDMLLQRFGDQLKQNVQLTGKDHRPFSVKGSLASISNTVASSQNVNASPVSFPSNQGTPSSNNTIPSVATGGFSDFSGRLGLSWNSANVYGIVAGPGDVSAQLSQGVGQFAPIDIAVNEGKLHATPAIHFEQNPFLVVLPQERIIDHIRLSPELCRGWVKFALPMLADSAQVDGRFSFDVQGASLPLSGPMMGNLDGTLSVHRAQVTPGPMGLQIVGLIDKLQSIIARRQPGDPGNPRIWVELPEQQVPVKLYGGRIYHEGMTFLVKNVTVRTSGAVGVDESLNLIAEIAIRDEWLGNNGALASLKGQSIQIPIGGTLSRPRPDPSAFGDLLQRIGGSAIEGLLQDKVGGNLDNAINNGLDKLFNRK